MSSAEVVLGSINQGAPHSLHDGLWRPGDELSAYERHIVFFGHDHKKELMNIRVIGDLRQMGAIICRVTDRVEIPDIDCELAILESENDVLYRLAERFIGVELHQTVLTLPTGSVVQPGDLYQFNFLSLLEPQGEGVYQLLHDYPLTRERRPRFEIIECEVFEDA